MNDVLKKAAKFFVRCALMIALICLIGGYAIRVSAEPSVSKKRNYYPTGSPTRAIQELDDTLDDFNVAPKGKNLTSEQEAHNKKVKQDIIHGTFDIRELSKLSLSKHWKERKPDEQDQFVKLLTDLLEEKALFSKEQSAAKSKTGGKYYVVYRGHKFLNPEKTRSFVRTKVVVPSENIDIMLNYRLKKMEGEWKIYDVIVDEASLVDNYRFQFDSIIKKHGYEELVGRMNKKLQEIRGKRNS
ncbi:MAG: ABC transporter substrate-binding protein [Pseudomonadota bacterium]